jgi:hypothetical protein
MVEEPLLDLDLVEEDLLVLRQMFLLLSNFGVPVEILVNGKVETQEDLVGEGDLHQLLFFWSLELL